MAEGTTHDRALAFLFGKCFLSWYEGLHLYAFEILGDNEEARDIVHAAFARLWKNKDQFDGTDKNKAYLYAAVGKWSRRRLRASKNRLVHINRVAWHQISLKAQSPTEYKELVMLLDNAVSCLPDRCREVFIRSMYEGKQCLEIAKSMNISMKTVEVHLGKALKILRIRLKNLLLVNVLVFL